MKCIFSLILPLLFVQQVFADHEVGNGGGTVCLAGQCMTLAEAGLRIPGPDEEFFLIPPKILQEVNRLLHKLPMRSYREDLMDKIAGRGNTYRLLDIAAPDKLEVIRQRYADVLKKYNSSINPHEVKVVAFAANNHSTAVTYLLPGFFALPIEKQAKILIHEANVKNSFGSVKFEDVLEFDGLMEDLLQDPQLIIFPKFRIDRWEVLLSKVAGSSLKSSSMANWLAWLQVNKSIIFSSDICNSGPDYCSIDIQKAQMYYDVTPAFVRFLNEITRDVNRSIFAPKVTPTFDVKSKCDDLLGSTQENVFFIPELVSKVDYAILRLNCKRGADGSIEVADAYNITQ